MITALFYLASSGLFRPVDNSCEQGCAFLRVYVWACFCALKSKCRSHSPRAFEPKRWYGNDIQVGDRNGWGGKVKTISKFPLNMANSLSNIRRLNDQRMDLPGVDEAKLKARLYAKPQLEQNPKALKFSGITASQKKKVLLLVCFSNLSNNFNLYLTICL